jgi:hypothetical protein
VVSYGESGMNTELAKVCPAARGDLQQRFVAMARQAVKAEGLQTLALPGPAVAAAHEAGHAVLFAALNNPPWQCWIKHCRADGGYTGGTDFQPDAPKLHIQPNVEPLAAINRACSTLAGWAAESLFERAELKAGSSLDEWTVAMALARSAAPALNCEAERLLTGVISATLHILEREAVAVRTVQKLLLRENRLRGLKLHSILANVERRDVAALVLTGPPCA